MSKIKGITVTIIYPDIQVGEDDFGDPIRQHISEDVDNVLVSPQSTDDVVSTADLEGRTEVYVLAIPKGDTHEWEGAVVEFFGKRWKVFAIPSVGIEDNIPLLWNKKVLVERYV